MAEQVHDAARLKELQALPLDRKIEISKARIVEWHTHFGGKTCVSVSGGKDSQVLADLVQSIYPETPLVYADTGLEYPEVRQKAKEMGAAIIRPKMPFPEVISTYGYPLFGKQIAENIYYARRIKPTADNTPRSKVVPRATKCTYWKRKMLLGQRERSQNDGDTS